MDNLEKQLTNLPKPELSSQADFKIKSKIYRFIFYKNLKNIFKSVVGTKHLFTRVAMTTLVVFVLLIGTSLYAYADDSITVGDTLYPLKKAIENIEQKININQNSKVNTFGKMSEKRVKEALNLAGEIGDATEESDDAHENIKQTINEVVGNIDSAVKASGEIGDLQKANQAKEEIKRKNENIIEYLDNISDIAEENSHGEIVQEIEKAKEEINKYNSILDGDEDGQGQESTDSNEDNGAKNTDSGSSQGQGSGRGGGGGGR